MWLLKYMYNIESKSNKQYYLAGYSLTIRITFSWDVCLGQMIIMPLLTLLHTGSPEYPHGPWAARQTCGWQLQSYQNMESSRMTYQKDQGPGWQTCFDQIHLEIGQQGTHRPHVLSQEN